MGELKEFPHKVRVLKPKKIMRPCDYGLLTAVTNLETQLGTIEAYNRLVTSAEELQKKITNGKAVAPNPIYAKDPKGKS